MREDKNDHFSADWPWPIRILFSIGGVILFVRGERLASQDSVTAATVVFAAGALCFFFCALPLLAKVEWFRLKAELKQKLHEADVMIAHLKKFSLPIAETLLNVLAVSDRPFYSMSKSESDRHLKSVIERLEELRISREEIDSARTLIDRMRCYDMASEAREMWSEIAREYEKTLHERLKEFPRPIKADDPNYLKISEELRNMKKWMEAFRTGFDRLNFGEFADYLETSIGNCKVFGAADVSRGEEFSKEIIADLRYYEAHRDFRRPEKWFQGDKKCQENAL